jgi:hypothetical protein
VVVLPWSGVLVPRVTVLGVEADVVARVDHRAHALRRERGQGPVLDRDLLAMWEWPEVTERAPEVVRISGAVCSGPTWRRALSDARKLSGFCATAIRVDEVADDCRLECAYAGVALVVDGRVVEPGRVARASGARRRTLDRWVEELVYQRLIEDGTLP